MKELILIPVIGIMILSFVPELLTIAESSQLKAVNLADDMNNAIDCATRGVALEECSPNLMSYNFTPELDRTVGLNKEVLELLDQYKDEYSNITVTDLGNSTVIIIS